MAKKKNTEKSSHKKPHKKADDSSNKSRGLKSTSAQVVQSETLSKQESTPTPQSNSEQIPASKEIKEVKPESTKPQQKQSGLHVAKRSSEPLLSNPVNGNRIMALSLGTLGIAATLLFVFAAVPAIMDQRDQERTAQEQRVKKEEEERKTKERNEKIAQENTVLKFNPNQTWTLDMNVKDFGTISIDMKESWAPKTVENFVRLSYRGYYDNSIIHRIVEQPNFSVIQGGDADKKDGTGGESAFGTGIPDELWVVKPEFKVENNKNKLVNKPKFRAPEFYKNFDTTTGFVQYPKGLILMAKTDAPDSAGSQFFITLTNTNLPAQYTVFGKIKDTSFPVLDKISKEVDPVSQSSDAKQKATDGKPNKELQITTLKIVKPEIKK